jgi:Mrp family chromosome partitioning ATPase
MKFAIISVLALVTATLGANVPQKAVIVSYPDETPDSVINQAMDAIKDAGGMITHEYRLIK